MPLPGREPRDQSRAQESLRINDDHVWLRPHRASERADLMPRLDAQRRRAPASRSDRNDAVDRAVQPYQRRKSFLHHPADTRAWPVAARIGHGRHVMDHIAERGRLDEQNIGHGLPLGIRKCSETPHNRFFTEARVEIRIRTLYGNGPMTVLVTGGAGYIGSHMVLALLAAGEKPVVLDNLSTGFDWAIPEGVPLVLGETGDQPLVAKLIKAHGIEAIIHFAASIVVPDSVADPLGYYKNNTVNSRALIECAVQGGVKHFIFSSTAAVYGNTERVPVTEDDPLLPMSPYGWSKLMSEIMLRDASAAHD